MRPRSITWRAWRGWNWATTKKRRLQAELGQILAHFADLEQLATDQIAPTAMVVRTELPLREDEAKPSLPREEVIANAPEPRAGFFAVPAVLDQ